MLGPASGGSLGGSAYLADRTGKIVGTPPTIDLALEKELQALVRALIADDVVTSAHDLSEGGLAVALVECCVIDGPVGARVALPRSSDDLAVALFGEAPSRIIVTTRPGGAASIAQRAGNVPVATLGTTGGDRLIIGDAVDVAVESLRDARERCLEPIVGA